jgi:hypothetical protein
MRKNGIYTTYGPSTSYVGRLPNFCRLIWALVHSAIPGHVQRGLDMAQAALQQDKGTKEQDRELKYFVGGEQLLWVQTDWFCRCCTPHWLR